MIMKKVLHWPTKLAELGVQVFHRQK